MATMLVSQDRLITCAHVVKAALHDSGFDPNARVVRVALRWPLAPTVSVEAEVLAEGWVPLAEYGGRDLAVLSLADATPAEHYPATIAERADSEGHGFRAYGGRYV